MSDAFSAKAQLEEWLGNLVSDALVRYVSSQEKAEIIQYLTSLLVGFSDAERLYLIRDAAGRPITDIATLLAAGDLAQDATSLGRTRQVHRHLGDFLLFGVGVFPQFLHHDPDTAPDRLVTYSTMGRESYYLVSSFKEPPHDAEAPTYRRLGDGFDDYAFCLRVVRDNVGLGA